MLLPRVAAHAPGVREQRAFVYADARLVRLELGRLEEAHVVGGDHRHAAARRERHGAGDVGLLERPAEALQLEIETPRQQAEPGSERAFGIRLARVDERAADVAFLGAGQRDQALERGHRQPAALDARHAALLALEIGTGHEPREVAVTLLRLTEQRQARGRRAFTLLRYPQIDAHDRLHAAAQRLAVELDHREEIALVGDRDRRHARRRHRCDELGDPHHAVTE